MFTVVIPTHNEENRVRETLAGLLSFLRAKYPSGFEVVVIDDGSDGTMAIVRRFAAVKSNRIRLFHYPKRMGKGGALMAGLRKARGSAVITYDADAAVPPKEIPRMLTELRSADLVIGSRAMPASVIIGRVPIRRRVASKAFNVLVNALFGLGVGDTQCGFKGMRTAKVLPLLPSLGNTGFEWDVELLLLAMKTGLRIAEMPVEWHHKKEGKVVLRDVARMLGGIARLRRRHALAD